MRYQFKKCNNLNKIQQNTTEDTFCTYFRFSTKNLLLKQKRSTLKWKQHHNSRKFRLLNRAGHDLWSMAAESKRTLEKKLKTTLTFIGQLIDIQADLKSNI